MLKCTWKQEREVVAHEAMQAKHCPCMDQPRVPPKNSNLGQLFPDLPYRCHWCLLEARPSDPCSNIFQYLHKQDKTQGHSSPCGSQLNTWDQWLTNPCDHKGSCCQLSWAPASIVQEKPDSPMALWGRRHKHLVTHSLLSLPNLAKGLRAAFSTSLLSRKYLASQGAQSK